MRQHVLSAVIALLIVGFLGASLGTLSFAAFDDTSGETAPPQLSALSDTLWAEQLTTFQQLLQSDAKAARVELRRVAKILFGEHRLAEEWVPLYFRICQNGTEYPSDVKRVSELEIRMLTAINTEKYAEQIRHHREALERLDTPAKGVDTGELLLGRQPPGEQTETPDAANALRIQKMNTHAAAFEGYLFTDVKAARAELATFASLMFGEHPLKEEWMALFFRLSREKEATMPELIQLTELHIQMLKDTAPEREAEQIAVLTFNLKQLQALRKLFKRQGNLAQKTPFNISLSTK